MPGGPPLSLRRGGSFPVAGKTMSDDMSEKSAFFQAALPGESCPAEALKKPWQACPFIIFVPEEGFPGKASPCRKNHIRDARFRGTGAVPVRLLPAFVQVPLTVFPHVPRFAGFSRACAKPERSGLRKKYRMPAGRPGCLARCRFDWILTMYDTAKRPAAATSVPEFCPAAPDKP